MVRHFPDDVYMAGRLLQWVCTEVNNRIPPYGEEPHENSVTPGALIMHIGNAHLFAGDVEKIRVAALYNYGGEW